MHPAIRTVAAVSVLLAVTAIRPVHAGTALAVASGDRGVVTLINVPTDPSQGIESRAATAPHAASPGLTPDGRTAFAFTHSDQLVAVDRSSATELELSVDPNPVGWIGNSGKRLINLNPLPGQALVVDFAAGGSARLESPLGRLLAIDCTPPTEGEGFAYCLASADVVRVDASTGEVISSVARASGHEIAWGTAGRVVVRRDGDVIVIDPLSGNVLEGAIGIGAMSLSSDPSTDLLLVRTGPETIQIRTLGGLELLGEIELDSIHGAIEHVELLHGGAGLAVIAGGWLTLESFSGDDFFSCAGDSMAVGHWNSVDVEVSFNGASQASVDAVQATASAVQSQLAARLDATVSSRATQASVDSVATAVAAVASGVSQANARLDATVSSRATQASVDGVATAVDGVATAVDGVGVDVDGVAAGVNDVAADVGGVATQVSDVDADLDSVATQLTDVDADLGRVATDVAAILARTDVATSTRASQASLDSVASGVTAIQARVDVPVGSRAAEASVDAIADDLATATADAAEAHARIMDAIGLAARRGIEASLLAGHVEPMFLVPGGADADPALDGVTCPDLAAAGHSTVHADGQFEAVRCVTGRAITALRAIGEDTRGAERSFADGEAERLAQPPDYRAALDDYARALESLARGH